VQLIAPATGGGSTSRPCRGWWRVRAGVRQTTSFGRWWTKHRRHRPHTTRCVDINCHISVKAVGALPLCAMSITVNHCLSTQRVSPSITASLHCECHRQSLPLYTASATTPSSITPCGHGTDLNAPPPPPPPPLPPPPQHSLTLPHPPHTLLTAGGHGTDLNAPPPLPPPQHSLTLPPSPTPHSSHYRWSRG
jgi:hypothetical protein